MRSQQILSISGTYTLPGPSLRQWLAEDDFGLALSSGFFGFFAHCGLLCALEDAGLKPARVSGSSAGALVAGLWAAGLEGAALRELLFGLRKQDFWDPAPGAGLLRGRRFRALLERGLPVQTFAECRVPLAVSAYDLLANRTRVLDQGALAPAIQASCCVPFLFHPVRHGGRLLLDGGIRDRPGLAGMPPGRVLYHHLAARSPWRRKQGAHTVIPAAPGLQALVIENLPRSGPNRLDQGPQAFATAYAATQAALDRPLHGPVLRIGPDHPRGAQAEGPA
jgi:NTE family protein